MRPAMVKDATHIIGLDLGDGESCLAYVTSNSLDEPAVYRFRGGSGSIPSAIADYKQGLKIGVAIGEDALVRENKTDLNINFKWDPLSEPDQWKLLKE
jgi:molecular chaperone DnaK (HSP70)